MSQIGSVLLLLASASCASAINQEEKPHRAMTQSEDQSSNQHVANLPFSRGRTFATLDSYLAYLEQYNGPLDMPWWREISPGVYRYEIRMADGPKPEIATRAELEKRFGFATSR